MLRERLNAACDHVTPERNIELVRAIARESGCDVVPMHSAHDMARYTCLMHALDFVEKPEYLSVAVLQRPGIYAGKKFAEWLLARGWLSEIKEPSVPVGSLVIYFDEVGAFTHIGITSGGNRVQSKWGLLGLYEHDLFDIPSSYGNVVRYFEPLQFNDAIQLFYDYAKENGMVFMEKVDRNS